MNTSIEFKRLQHLVLLAEELNFSRAAERACLSQTAYRKCDDCLSEAECEIRHVFFRVAEATRDVLFSATIADTLNEKNRAAVMLAG